MSARPIDQHLLLAAGEVAGLHGAALLEPGKVLVHALDARHRRPVRLDVGARDEVLLGGEVLEDPAPLEDLHDAALTTSCGGSRSIRSPLNSIEPLVTSPRSVR
jgi:hypothetical protein